MELLAIIRRIDTDGDASVVFSEWSEFIAPLLPVPRVAFEPPPRLPSPAYRASSPIRTASPSRGRSAGPRAAYQSPARVAMPPPRATISPSRLSPSRKPILRIHEEDDMIHALKEQCNLEAELESGKINLANKSDFNLFDAFNIFDINRNGFITVHELLHGLASIGVHTTYDECELFITRYDKNGDRRISSPEFSEAFLAFDPYCGSMVSRRPSNYVPRPIRPDDCFLPNTAYEF